MGWGGAYRVFQRVRHAMLKFSANLSFMYTEVPFLERFAAVPPALGAFYFLLRIETPLEPMTIVERLIRDFGVAAIPGTTFGMHEGCYLRVAYGALDADTIAEGMGRLVRGLKAIVGK